MIQFCGKYIVLMEVLLRDRELNQWCRSYSAYAENTAHCHLERILCHEHEFMQEAYDLGFMPEALPWWSKGTYSLETALSGTEADLISGIFTEIRSDCGSNGSLINNAIANGNLYRLMRAFLSTVQRPKYTLEYIMAQKREWDGEAPGASCVRHDDSMGKWHLRIQLDTERRWFLSVFVRDDGVLDKYSLDKEVANDSHYEFVEEQKLRNNLYEPGDEKRYFHEIRIRYLKNHGGNALLNQIKPFITEQFHYG